MPQNAGDDKAAGNDKAPPALPTVTPLLFRNKHDNSTTLTNVVLLFHGARPQSARSSATPGHTTLPMVCSVLAGAPAGTVVVLFECRALADDPSVAGEPRRLDLGQISKALAQAVQTVVPPLLEGRDSVRIPQSNKNGWFPTSPKGSRVVVPEEDQLPNLFGSVRDWQHGKRAARGGGMLDRDMLETLFTSGDWDGSGTLDRDEAIRCLEAAAQLEPQRWFEEVYAHLAAQPDSMISLEDFMSLADGPSPSQAAPSPKGAAAKGAATKGAAAKGAAAKGAAAKGAAAKGKKPAAEPARPRVSVISVREGCWLALKLLHHGLLSQISDLILVAPVVCRFMGPMEQPIQVPTLLLYGARDAAVLADAGSADPKQSWERLVSRDMLLVHKLEGVNGPTMELQPDASCSTKSQPKLAAGRTVGSAARELCGAIAGFMEWSQEPRMVEPAVGQMASADTLVDVTSEFELSVPCNKNCGNP